MSRSTVDVRTRQEPLRRRYRREPEKAPVVLRARSAGADLADPLHCLVEPGSVSGAPIRGGAHPAVGGDADAVCSGELLLAALATCQEITMRMVAANIGVELEDLDVSVEGDWDPRGTLAMGREFPVGITAIRIRTRVTVAGDVDEERSARLLRSAERYCVVLDTLRSGPAIESSFVLGEREQEPDG